MRADRHRDPSRATKVLDLAVAALTQGIGRLPLPLAAWIGRRAGDLMFWALPRRRRTALENLARAWPERQPAQRRRLARRSFEHLGLMLVELCRMLTRPVDELIRGVRVDGLEHLRGVMDAHGRALLLTAHLGNWEIFTAAYRLAGYPLAIVVRRLESGALDALATRWRERAGVQLIDKRDAVRPVLRALRDGTLVGILLDQNAARDEAVFVPFFGTPASTSKSIAVLALRTGTPVVPVFTRREGPGRHRIVVHPPLMPAARPSEAAVLDLTARCTEAIERAIRETPEQWLWSHNRWRTRPAGERRGWAAGE